MAARFCICGGMIEWRELPPSIMNDTGLDGFWCHTNGDTRCYPDDETTQDAFATPEHVTIVDAADPQRGVLAFLKQRQEGI